MAPSDLFAEILSSIKTNAITPRVTRGGYGVQLGKVELVQKEFTWDMLADALPEVAEWPADRRKAFKAESKQIFMQLLDAAREIRDRPPEFNPENLYYDSWKKFPATDTEVLLNPAKPNKVVLFNTLTAHHDTVDYKYLERAVFPKVPKEYKGQLLATFVNVKETYCPDLPAKYHILTDEQKIFYPHLGEAIFNYYVAPANTLLPRPLEPRLHPILKKFFEHLFINEDSRTYMYRWMYTLTHIFHRTTPIVILCGKAAIGKNTLIENILVGLIGEQNFHKAAQLSERFNASVLNCQLHFYDEGTLEGHAKRNLKGFHELFVAIERKGIDVAAPERIYARFVIATNNRTDVRLDGNDRKFSVPEITDVKLTDAFTEEEQQFLFKFKTNVDAQVEFLAWLEANHKHDAPEKPYHGPLFREICYESLPHWFQAFLSKCEAEEEFTLKSFKKDIDVKSIGVDKIKERLQAYEHENKIRVADIEKDGGTTIFKSLIYKKGGPV